MAGFKLTKVCSNMLHVENKPVTLTTARLDNAQNLEKWVKKIYLIFAGMLPKNFPNHALQEIFIKGLQKIEQLTKIKIMPIFNRNNRNFAKKIKYRNS